MANFFTEYFHFKPSPIQLLELLGSVINKEGVAALACLVDESHLEELVDDLKDELLGVEVVELMAHRLVDVLERHASAGAACLEHVRDEHVQLLLLISNLYCVATSRGMSHEAFRL